MCNDAIILLQGLCRVNIHVNKKHALQFNQTETKDNTEKQASSKNNLLCIITLITETQPCVTTLIQDAGENI